MKRLLKFIYGSGIVLCLILTLIFACIRYNAFYASPEPSDTLIVLGCQIWGTSPSPILEYRLAKALELYREGYAGHIIVSGGQGRDEAAPESRVMKNWLVTHGIPEIKILEEPKSSSTYENLKFSKEIMADQHFRTAILVSSDFHIFRALKTARKLGIEATGAPASTLEYLKPYYNFREVLSVIKSIVLNK